MKKFVAIFLSTILLLTPIMFFTVGATSKDINEQKITDELKNTIAKKMIMTIFLYTYGFMI